jgi:prepilin-type N-terminal cleavage/methylation domain-containing protein
LVRRTDIKESLLEASKVNIRSELQTRTSRRGVTLTELLVVLTIIGLLATMVVPTYLKNVNLARVRTAQEEVARLSEAEEIVALKHGFYVSLVMLDDNPSLTNNDQDHDDLFNTAREIDPMYLIDPFIEVNSQLTSGQLTLQDGDPGAGTTGVLRVRNLVEFWDGPFMNFTRVWTGIDFNVNVVQDLDDDERANDHPLDPWNNPYRLYSPIGIVGADADDDDPQAFDREAFANGLLTYNGQYEFDRFAIVSYGPNGEEGDGNDVDTMDNDDIFHTFGFIPSTTRLRRF